MFSLLLNRTKLWTLKKRILEDEANYTADDLELKDKKRIRFVLAAFFLYFHLLPVLFLSFPLFSSDEFAMPVYMQFPLVK